MKRCIVYGVIWFVLLCSYIYTAGYGIFVVLIIMALLPVISAGYALFVRDKIYVDIKSFNDVLIRGERLGYDIVVKNTALLMVSDINLKIRLTYNNYDSYDEEAYEVAVNGTDKEFIKLDRRMDYVGVVTINTNESYIKDPLKMFKFSIKHSDKCSVTVMPVLNEPDYYSFYSVGENSQDSAQYSKKRKGEDTSQIFDIRGFVNGDALNRIHWKLSAKADELLVKEFSHPITKNNCILLEMHKYNDMQNRLNLNGVFEMMYAIGNLACVKEKQFSLAFYSVADDELKIMEVLSLEELVETVMIIINQPAYEGNKALKHYLEYNATEGQKLYYITDMCDDSILTLEECAEITAYIYCVNDSVETGKVTKFVRHTMFEVDRDDINWGLSNTQI